MCLGHSVLRLGSGFSTRERRVAGAGASRAVSLKLARSQLSALSPDIRAAASAVVGACSFRVANMVGEHEWFVKLLLVGHWLPPGCVSPPIRGCVRHRTSVGAAACLETKRWGWIATLEACLATGHKLCRHRITTPECICSSGCRANLPIASHPISRTCQQPQLRARH